MSKPSILPTTPEAAAFQKYGDYPVEYYTGIPRIEIPIYEIKTSRFKLPISLSYHASGFKPNQEVGSIGLGWTMNNIPRISRLVQGEPDEILSFPEPLQRKNDIDYRDLADQHYLAVQDLNVAFSQGGMDAEYDVFYYSLLDGQGKFFLKNLGSGARTPVTSPFRPVKIVSNSNYFRANIDYFEITNENGDLYRYSLFDTTTPDIHNPDLDYRSSWLITEIISYDKSDTIKFKYQARSRSTISRVDQFVVRDDGFILNSSDCTSSSSIGCQSGYGSGSAFYNSYIRRNTANHTINQLTEIVFKGGSIKLEYVPGIGQNEFIDRILVYDSDDNINRIFDLVQSPYSASNKYYKFERMEVKDASEDLTYQYTFDYHDTFYSVPDNHTENTGIDRWGFYNGRENENNNLLPNWQLSASNGQIFTAGQADRETNENAMKNFVLKKITYPTGGDTEFIFEANRMYQTASTQRLIGGLRIKQIISRSEQSSNTVVKTYKYGENEDGNGWLQSNPYELTRFTQTYWDVKLCTLCTSGVETPLAAASYGRVRIINSDFSDGSGIFETYPVFYTHITEYYGDEVNNSGKTLYVFSEPSSNQYSGDTQNMHLKVVMDWKGRNLIRRNVYRNDNGTYTEVERTENTYLNVQTEILPGFRVTSNLYGKSTSNSSFSDLFFYTSTTGISDPYDFNDYDITIGVSRLINQVLKKGNLTTLRDYTYGGFHNQPIVINETSSTGKQLTTEFKYPQDIVDLSGTELMARNTLIEGNVLSPVLRERYTKDGMLIYKKENVYKNLTTSLAFPEKVDLQVGNSENVTKLNYQYDAMGNLISYRTSEGVDYSYIYSTESNLPIAEFINALPSQVFHTSFEDNGIMNNSAKTGRKCFDGDYIFSPPADFSVVPNSKLSFWYWTNGSWHYKEQIYNGGIVSLTDGEKIDELRILPPSSQMRTYTYDLLHGITSICDFNGIVTDYSYDNFGRLQTVRDQEDAIIKKYTYHFKTGN